MSDQFAVALSVDALSPRLTGIGRYCLELVRGVPQAKGVGKVSFFQGSDWLDDPEQLLVDGWKPKRKSRLRRWLEGSSRLKHPANTLVHGPNYFLPDWAEGGVITVHDLSVLLYPETHPIERVRDFERRFRSSLDRAAAIITDCETVRGEVISMLGVPSEMVRSVALGVSSFTHAGDAAQVRELDLAVGGYCLCVSTYEPRKRIDALIKAYGRLDPALRKSVPLVLAGASGWNNDALHRMIDQAQAEGWVVRLDFVPDRLLASLYVGARLFVYPSNYEGFGLPPLEAMQHGIPTLIGKSAALAEVTKGAARVVDADDIDAFAALLADSIEDRHWQRDASVAGRRVAQTYEWSDCVAATVDVYRQASV